MTISETFISLRLKGDVKKSMSQWEMFDENMIVIKYTYSKSGEVNIFHRSVGIM